MKRLTFKIIISLLLACVGGGLYAESGEIIQVNKAKQFVVIVNKANPVDTLTRQQIKQIFLGRLRRFPGVDQEMNVKDLATNSDAYKDFYEHVIQMAPERLKRYRARYLFSGQGRLPKVIESQATLLARIAQDKYAIGYVSLDQDVALSDNVRVIFEYTASD